MGCRNEDLIAEVRAAEARGSRPRPTKQNKGRTKMKTEGLKIIFLGDSITQGVGVKKKENIYADRVCRSLGFAEMRNYGISGTRLARQQRYPDYTWVPKWDDHCFSDRFEQMDDDADVVVVFGGTNDFGHGNAPFGEESDREPESFIGACHYLFASLVIKYPASHIIAMTPIHRETENTPSPVTGKVLEDYVDVIRRVATEYGISVLDTYNLCPIDPSNPEHKAKYVPDGLHPCDEGQRLLAEVLEEHIRNL